jgi:4-hydroxy-tetrahydrodipicolinate synthase
MWQGSMVALVTPMRGGVSPDAPVDYPRLQQLIDFHIESGTDAIVAVGTTGESATLDEDEHCEVLRRIAAFAAGRIPLIAGTGANSTVEAIHLTRAAKEAGYGACLLVTPYYNKPTQEGLYLHHKAVAEAVDIPQILYNVPGRTACDLLPETAGRLSRIPNIIGIKEATGDLTRVARLQSLCRAGFLLFSGDDATTLDFILAGGHGTISVTANCAPRAMHEMCSLAAAGRVAEARAIDARLAGLHRDLFVEANPIPVKWAMARMGRMEEGIRLPLTWLSPQHHETVRQALAQAGIAV